MAGWLGSTFAALEYREFRILWIGTWLSFMGFFMSTIVQSVVAFELEGINTAVGSVVFAQGVAMMTLSPVGGALADRWPKRRVVAAGQMSTALVFVGLAGLVFTDQIRVLHLAVGSLVMGATFAFLGPARQALVVEVVPQERRGNAVALSQVANTGSRVLGPAMAGFFLASSGFGGAASAYLAMAALYLSSAVLLVFLPKSRVPVGAKRPLGADVLEGFRYVARTPRLRTILVFYTLVIMFGFPHVTLLPGLLENQLGREAADVSVLFLTSAVGALSASLSLARFADSAHGSTLFALMGGVFGVSLFALSAAPSYLAAAVAMFFIGAGSGGFQALGSAVAVGESEPALVGRVMSLTMLAFAGFGLMGLPIGALADLVGERSTLSGMSLAVCGLSIALAIGLSRSGPRVVPG